LKPLYTYPVVAVMAASALWADPVSIEHIVVSDTAVDDGLFVADTNGTEERFGRKSIATLSTQANMNPYTVIQYSPSVNFTPVDQTGSNEPSYHDPIRIRAKSQTGPGGVYMIDGMPISSNPGGGKQILDMENVASIDLLKGYLGVDKNLGFSSLIGKIDMNILTPRAKAGATLSQSIGSSSFKRTFARFDSGKIGDVAIFGSISTLQGDKTKGAGDQQRINGMIGLSYAPSARFQADLYMIRNADKHHNYASLTYAEAKDLDTYFNKDFGMTQPTTASNDYYDWNKQDFDTTAFLGNIRYNPGADDTITLKPYYKRDVGQYWFSKTKNGIPMVMNWEMDHDLYGGIAEYEHAFGEALRAKIGYWYHKQLPPGPPTDQKKYVVNASGQLVYKGYGILADDSHHTLQSPFIEFSGDLDKFHYVLGAQYQTFELASIDSYTGTDAATSKDYDTALSQAALDPWSSVKAKRFYTFLPSVYLGYDLAETTSLYVDYSRTYGFDVNLYPTYMSNRATFVNNGITLQQLWDDLNLETSDNIDLGVRTLVGALSLNPNLYVSFVKNKQANVYDSALGVNYPSNTGDALGYGAELAANGPINENLTFILGLSYNKYYFTENFKTSAGATSDIKGNQLPDAPEFMAKGALSYALGGWTFTPSARYTSSRYGDVENTQKIDAYTVVDLDIAYQGGSFLGSRSSLFRLTATNLTNEKYIATIITADNVLASTTTSSTYQTGAPFGLYGSVSLSF
jgi:iron complex outermembrane recepter protein